MSKKVFVITPHAPDTGGIAQHGESLCKELSKTAQVTAITFKRLYPALLQKTTKVVATPTNLPYENWQGLDALKYATWKELHQKITTEQPDVIIVQWWHPFFALMLGKLLRWVKNDGTKTKIIFICHNVLPHERFPGDALLTKYALATADRFLVHYNAGAKLLREWFPSKTAKVVSMPLLREFPIADADAVTAFKNSIGLTEDHKVILTFGYVRPYKGLEILLEAVQKVAAASRVHLLIVGEWRVPKSRFQIQFSDPNVAHNVTIIDSFVPDTYVGIYFGAADYLVLTHTEASQTATTPLAHHLGLPCIMSDAGGLPETARPELGDKIFKAGDSDALATAILEAPVKPASSRHSAVTNWTFYVRDLL